MMLVPDQFAVRSVFRGLRWSQKAAPEGLSDDPLISEGEVGGRIPLQE